MAYNPFLSSGGYGWPNSGGSANGSYDTDYVKNYISPEVPRGEYETYLTQNNLGGFGRRDDAARSLYSRTDAGFQAATLQNPTLSYRDYLNTYLGPDFFKNALGAMTPTQLGDRPSMWSGPTRVVGRA